MSEVEKCHSYREKDPVGSAGELIKLKNKYHTLHDKLLEKKPKLEKLGKYLYYLLLLIYLIIILYRTQSR